jgi:hypothetical protein
MIKKRDINPEQEQEYLIDPGFRIVHDLRHNFSISPHQNQMNSPVYLWLSDF